MVVLIVKWREAAQEDVSNHANAPHVHFLAVGLAFEDLGRHVPGSPACGGQHRIGRKQLVRSTQPEQMSESVNESTRCPIEEGRDMMDDLRSLQGGNEIPTRFPFRSNQIVRKWFLFFYFYLVYKPIKGPFCFTWITVLSATMPINRRHQLFDVLKTENFNEWKISPGFNNLYTLYDERA